MSTPLTDKIMALTAQVNATIGRSDITLTDALQSLINAYQNKNGQLELWKTITIEENHTSASTANPIYWMSYFQIPEEDILSGTIYILKIANDQEYATQHPSWHIWPYSIYFKDKLGEVNNFACRTNTAIQGMSTNNYQYISTGAVVEIYKFKLKQELYSVGTELVTRYIGRLSDSRGDFYVGRINITTGQIWREIDEDYPSSGTTYGVSLNYIPVDTGYTYKKWLGYLYYAFCYDDDFNYLGYFTTPTVRNEYELPIMPEGTKYIRIAIHSNMSYRDTIIVRTA